MVIIMCERSLKKKTKTHLLFSIENNEFTINFIN